MTFGEIRMSPLPVRIVWWLSVLMATWGIVETISFVLFPSSHYLAVLAKLPAGLRAPVHRADMQIAVLSAAFWAVVILSLAWFAAARHSNLARWGIVLVLLVRETISLIVAVAYGQLHSYVTSFGQEDWTRPSIYIVPALEIFAVVCLFSPGARSWFKERKFRRNAGP